MKKEIILLLLLAACSLFARAQKHEPSYYIGKTFVVDSLPSGFQQFGYPGFIKDLKGEPDDPENIAVANPGKYGSDYNKMVGQKLKCTDAGASPHNGFNFLKLSNDNIGTVYYEYISVFDPKNMTCLEAQEAENKDFKTKLDNICSTITGGYNKLHDATEFSTAYSSLVKPGEHSLPFNVTYFKDIKGQTVTYSVLMEAIALSPMTDRKGVTLLLANGHRIKKPLAVVETSVSDNAEFVRKSIFDLNAADRAALKASPLVDFELYVEDAHVVNPDQLYRMFLCLLDKK